MEFSKSNLQIESVRRTFEEDGYVLVKNVFAKENAQKTAQWLRSQDLPKLAKSWTDQEPGVELAVYQNIHTDGSPVSTLSANTELLDLAGQLMGDKVYIWSSKVNLKAAWCGTAEYYHQDFVYWKDRGYEHMNMLSCMIFLDPHGVDNAGLSVLPGTHRLGFVDHVPFININGLSKFMVPPKTLDGLYKNHGRVTIEAQPGDVLFFHAGLIHGSSHNISEQPRMIILSQLNTQKNKPQNVSENAKAFNLRRAEMEVQEAKRRYEFFKKKYDTQFNSSDSDVTFNSPIPIEEKY
jgi:ectoine hydroxylase